MAPVHTSCFRRRLVGCARARARALLVVLRGVLVRGCEDELDWAGQVDRRLEGLHHLRGLLRRLWVVCVGRRALTGELGGLAYVYPF